MPSQRRLWDSSVVIGYLAGYPEMAEDCRLIIEQAERGELEILVSAMATIEVAYLAGSDDEDSELRIREFFSRDYIVPVTIDVRVASVARDLVRRHRIAPNLKPPDAVHLATAIQWGVPVIESTDTDLLRLDGLEGDPPITIRRPLYEGPRRLPGIS